MDGFTCYPLDTGEPTWRAAARPKKLDNTDLGDGIVVLSPRGTRVDQIADKLAAEWKDSGESLESMMSALREVRADYDAENPHWNAR